MDCNKKLTGQGYKIYEEIIVDGRVRQTEKVLGLVCEKCNKKRFSANLMAMLRRLHKRRKIREKEEKEKQRRLKKIKLL
ncbi:hypothetical protein [Neobacillus dielmonensis]|uniref:hypothetical protein n=1 Tax=Neobacillus dielmonensis TaxID=1347369 RepID=UPI0005A60013|nr:hypothetical protein [Neobacillus dielmonensis]